MRRALLCASLFAALSVPYDAEANDGTWTMPYTGNCSSSTCIEITGTGSTTVGVGAIANGVGVWGSSASSTGVGVRAQATSGKGLDASSTNGAAVFARSTNSYGVDTNGFVGIKSGGLTAVQAIGFTYGLDTTGGTSPIFLNGTIPSTGQNPLCKSTAGSSAGHVGFCSSTRALKESIQDLGLGVDTLMRLRPVAFRWKSNHTADLGFVAEDVAKVSPLLAVYNEKGELQSVKYTQMTALLTKVLQEQVRERSKVETDLKKQVSELQKHNADLTTQLREQQSLLKNLAARLSAVEQRSAALK